ncbi:hypothetical protein C8Q79DRAFT_195782 [Trametes meyenii]|nr:hypothetical protein C8Q79DRAFT_195782 [Trametes meyenii]
MSHPWQCTFPGCTYTSTTKQAVNKHYLAYHTVRGETETMSSQWARPLSPAGCTGHGSESSRMSPAASSDAHDHYPRSPSSVFFRTHYPPPVPSGSYYSREVRGSSTSRRESTSISDLRSPNVGSPSEENAASRDDAGAYSRSATPASQPEVPSRALSTASSRRYTSPPHSPALDKTPFEESRRSAAPGPYAFHSGRAGGTPYQSQVLPPPSVPSDALRGRGNLAQGPSGGAIHPGPTASPDPTATPLVPYDLLAAHGFFNRETPERTPGPAFRVIQMALRPSRYNPGNDGGNSRTQTRRHAPY